MTTNSQMGPLVTMECEQRQCKRLLVKDNVFAALRGEFRKNGKIDESV
jgi:hypothetical protein